jgi:hypothetical protein
VAEEWIAHLLGSDPDTHRYALAPTRSPERVSSDDIGDTLGDDGGGFRIGARKNEKQLIATHAAHNVAAARE